MPSYKNNNSYEVVLASNRIAPGDILETVSWYLPEELPPGVAKVADLPVYNPIISSAKLTNGGTVTIPEKDNDGHKLQRYLIHIFVKTGEPDIAFNLGSVANKLKGYPDMRWNVRVFERVVDKLVITGTSEVFVTIELI